MPSRHEAMPSSPGAAECVTLAPISVRLDTSIHTSLRSAFLKFLHYPHWNISSLMESYFLTQWCRVSSSNPMFDPVIGTLLTSSCNFQVQNIYMEALTKPEKVKIHKF